jgi:TonB family protein
MSAARVLRWVWISSFLFSAWRPPLLAQPSLRQLQEKLIGQPLYLRGFWMDNKLEFDGAGHVLGAAHEGPFTLSGVDVSSVTLSGNEIMVRGNRVALIAGPDGTLERRNISNTTTIWPSLRRGNGNKYVANLGVGLLVHADAAGSFDKALNTIFANGLHDLAPAMPPYWTCYAEGFFTADEKPIDAEKTVDECVQKHSLSVSEARNYETRQGFSPPAILGTIAPNFTQLAASLGVDGVSHVRFTVSRNGIPVGFQVVRAVGAGLDEETLKAVSEGHFQPATLDGISVAADLDVSLKYAVRP